MVNLHQVFRRTVVFCGFVVGFLGVWRLWVLIWSQSSAVEVVGFDLEPIWCRGLSLVARGAHVMEVCFCWWFVSVTVRRIGKVGERKEKKKMGGEERENNNILMK